MLIPNTFVEPLDMPFSRRGSYIFFANDNGGVNQYSSAHLWLCTARVRPTDRNVNSVLSPVKFRQVGLELIDNGIPQKCVIDTTPYEITLRCEKGSVSFCIGDPGYAVGKSSDGLVLRITPPLGIGGRSSAVNLLDGTWKSPFANYWMLFVPVRGTLREGPGPYLELMPDQDGVFEIICEESLVEPKKRDGYLNYEDSLTMVQKDFDAFAESLDPRCDQKYAARAKEALWTPWGLSVIPDGTSVYKRPMIKMMRALFDEAFSWQHAMHAYFLAHNLPLAWQLLLSCFDNQDSTGLIADALSYVGRGEPTKPPVQGVGLLYLMDHFDLSQMPREELEFLYDRMVKWTEFHLNYRDLDHDGLYENQTPFETGWEDATYFRIGFPLASPDMNAYLALQEEALGRLGRLIGKPDDECEAWLNRSADTVRKIIEKFWTNDGWTSVNIVTGERSLPTGLPQYCALLLGKRLPQEIIDRSVEIIFREPGFMTPFGLATENTTSPFFKAEGWCSGGIATPIPAMLVPALEECGKPELARKVAIQYLDLINEAGLFHMIDAVRGKKNENRVMTLRGERELFNSGWTAGCFIFLARKYASTE